MTRARRRELMHIIETGNGVADVRAAALEIIREHSRCTRRWQNRRSANKQCLWCGKPLDGASLTYCIAHLDYYREYAQKRRRKLA